MFAKNQNDQNGFITVRGFQKIFKKMGCKYTNQDVKKMIKAVDLDGDGKLSLEDFTFLLSL